jgi:hypothetical protein
MYRMYGQIFAPGNICTSTILGGRMTRCHGWQGAAHVQDVRTDICSRQYLHFHHPWRSYVTKSHGRRCDDVQEVRAGNCSLHYLHFHHPWRSYSAKSQGWRCAYVQEIRAESSSLTNAWLTSRDVLSFVPTLRISHSYQACWS